MRRLLVTPLIVSLFALSTFSAYGQSNNDDLKPVITKLKSFTDAHEIEQAYLHFDKPYYATGDTVYFKAYVTSGDRHELSTKSGILHVDLINPKNHIDRSIKLRLINGVAWGDFALADTLSGGNYRIRAYTQWMRNDESYFFYKTIPVGSLKHLAPVNIVKTQKTLSETSDLQFMPEGGALINDIICKVGFKAIGQNGLGVDVNGVVFDNENYQVCRFSSSHLGMGSFSFESVSGRKYRAQVTFPDRSKKVINLPTAIPEGIALSVNTETDHDITIQVQANQPYFEKNKNKLFSVLVYSGGVATTASGRLETSGLILKIPQNSLKTGVAKVTLFNEAEEPLCERLFFVNNPGLTIAARPDQEIYSPRGKVHIDLNCVNQGGLAATGYFSVSVLDENKVPFDENSETTIMTHLLLTSELKGYVEQPNYYFLNHSDAKSSLDLLMLTQGYRRFEWKQLLNNTYPENMWPPERELAISGEVRNMLGSAISKGTITLIPHNASGPLVSCTTDDKGLFRFTNLDFTDTTQFVLSAVNASGKNYTRINYDPEKAGPQLSALPTIFQSVPDADLTTYTENAQKEQGQFVNVKGKMLKEVKIKTVKRDDQYETQSVAGAGHADQVMHAEELEKVGGQLTDVLNGRLRGITFVGTNLGINGGGNVNAKYAFLNVNLHTGIGGNNATPMLVVLDGVPMKGGDGGPYFDLNTINPTDIETVEVLKYGSTAAYGMEGGAGVLVITTKRGSGTKAKNIASIGVLPITVQGYYKARDFYSPKYDHPNATDKRLDLRSTIYWKPDLVTEKDGSASIDFYCADNTGTYRVAVEGIDEKGNPGRQVFRLKIGQKL